MHIHGILHVQALHWLRERRQRRLRAEIRDWSGRAPTQLRRSSGLAAVIRRRRRLRSPATQIRRARTTAPRPQRTGKTEGEPQRRRQRALYPVACGPAGRHLPRRLPSLAQRKRYTGTRALLLHGATRVVSE